MHGGRESVSSLCLTGSKVLVIVQLLSCVRLLVTPWTAACQASLSFTISQNLFKFMSTESEIPSNHLIFCHPFFFCLQSFPASGSFLISRLFTSDGQEVYETMLSVNNYCCCDSVIRLWLTLCDPRDCSMPGFHVLHCLPEFVQSHVH